MSVALSLHPRRLVALMTLAVAVSPLAAHADDVYLDNGVYVKQLPAWRQRMIQKRMLRQAGAPVAGSEIVIQGPPAVRVASPPATRRAMRPLFGGLRVPATIIPQDEPLLITKPSTVVERPATIRRGVEPPAPIISNGPVGEVDDLDDLPPVDLPPARDGVTRPGTILSTPVGKPQAAPPPVELDPEPPLTAPAPAAAPASAPVTGTGSRPNRSA